MMVKMKLSIIMKMMRMTGQGKKRRVIYYESLMRGRVRQAAGLFPCPFLNVIMMMMTMMMTMMIKIMIDDKTLKSFK